MGKRVKYFNWARSIFVLFVIFLMLASLGFGIAAISSERWLYDSDALEVRTPEHDLGNLSRGTTAIGLFRTCYKARIEGAKRQCFKTLSKGTPKCTRGWKQSIHATRAFVIMGICVSFFCIVALFLLLKKNTRAANNRWVIIAFVMAVLTFIFHCVAFFVFMGASSNNYCDNKDMVKYTLHVDVSFYFCLLAGLIPFLVCCMVPLLRLPREQRDPENIQHSPTPYDFPPQAPVPMAPPPAPVVYVPPPPPPIVPVPVVAPPPPVPPPQPPRYAAGYNTPANSRRYSVGSSSSSSSDDDRRLPPPQVVVNPPTPQPSIVAPHYHQPPPAAAQRPTLGVDVKMLDDEYGNKDCVAVAHSVRSGGPLEVAGVRADDILVSINNHPLTSREVVRQVLNNLTIGSHCQVVINRGGHQYTVHAVVGGTSAPQQGPHRVASSNVAPGYHH